MKGLRGVIGRVRGWRRGWHERSKLQRIDLYTRVTLCAMVWLFLLTWGFLPLGTIFGRGSWALAIGATLLTVNVAQSLLSTFNVRPAFDHYRGAAPFPRRRLRLPAVLLVVLSGLLIALMAGNGLDDRALPVMAMDVPIAFGIPYALLVPARKFLLHAAAYIAAFVGLLAAFGGTGTPLLATALTMALGLLLVIISVRPSGWSLSVMWQAEEARDMQARLAVAEERLRFGRDMHDVLGRNLSVIALKSELAVELAQRGNPAAVDQMVEVQRIARASQQEVRDVVRGYREADLPTELMGARGVLQAAGISVTAEGADGPAGIGAPAAVQAALGWVVREAATNVLRHGDPRHCSIRLARTRDAVVLEVENDGAGAADPLGGGGDGGGSGLAGLRERLGALGGSLTAGPVGDDPDLFRVTATVPLTAPGPGGRTDSDPGRRTASAGGERATGDERAALGERTASGERAAPSAPPASPSPDPSALPEER
ncbi:histidine kinase [Streptomyces filamentosus]|uniref:Histidine kinase n=2 Tax=Streptomyces TaxID=1883 RepID=A0ABY4UW70_STRFL|nr:MULTISPECIES: histidine kinase [Streptomyces]MYR79875.1 sensor histidine kinase [Streptomyces sp. SID5466]USC48577.1 histidine kinase [Streptomyces filamentosus]